MRGGAGQGVVASRRGKASKAMPTPQCAVHTNVCRDKEARWRPPFGARWARWARQAASVRHGATTPTHYHGQPVPSPSKQTRENYLQRTLIVRPVFIILAKATFFLRFGTFGVF